MTWEKMKRRVPDVPAYEHSCPTRAGVKFVISVKVATETGCPYCGAKP